MFFKIILASPLPIFLEVFQSEQAPSLSPKPFLFEAVNLTVPYIYVSIGIFFLAWMGQFIGHNIEGKKPSFLKDLQFLLIGPAWVFEKLSKK